MTLEEKAKQKAKEIYPGEDYVCSALQGAVEKGYLASAKENAKQLKQAKEIIKQFLNDYPVITKEQLDKLEQFIKEE